ncbi:hypothetical protein LCGC14_0775460 [marine sediment metagenome]|uniref:Terminase small subunit n=1 Tax=marine sediment metagenome TaxID=412755 RepID=A0A0F9SH09_9ZZZZ
MLVYLVKVSREHIHKKRRLKSTRTVAMETVANRRVEFNEAGASEKPWRADTKTLKKKRRVKHNLADTTFPGVEVTIPEYEFCIQYLAMSKPNAGVAAELAGFARVTGAAILKKAMVKRCIRFMQHERSKHTNVRADQVVTELGRIALADPKECFDKHGVLLPIRDLPEDVRRAIASIETEEISAGRGKNRVVVGHVRKIKFWPKPKALEKLTQHVDVNSLFPQRVELTGKDGKELQSAVIYLPDNGRGDSKEEVEVGEE